MRVSARRSGGGGMGTISGDGRLNYDGQSIAKATFGKVNVAFFWKNERRQAKNCPPTQELRCHLFLIGRYKKLGNEVFKGCRRGVAGCASFQRPHVSSIQRRSHL